MLLGTLTALLSPPALAQEPAPPPPDLQRARELYENGRILYDEGHYEDAIAAWAESFRLSGRPELLYDISGAYEKLADYANALDFLDRYRAFAPAEERETLDRHIHSLEERADLQRRATPAPAPGPAPAPPPAPVVVAPAPVPVADRRGPPVVPILFVGTGVAGLGVGTWAGLRAGAAESDLRETCVAGDAGLLCPSQAEATVDRHGTSALVSAISLGAGGALTLTGAVLWAVHGSSGDFAVVPVIGQGGGGLSVRSQF